MKELSTPNALRIPIAAYLISGFVVGLVSGSAARLVIEVVQSSEAGSVSSLLQRVFFCGLFGGCVLAMVLLGAFGIDYLVNRGAKAKRWRAPLAFLTFAFWGVTILGSWVFRWVAGSFPAKTIVSLLSSNFSQILDAGMDTSWGMLAGVTAVAGGAGLIGRYLMLRVDREIGRSGNDARFSIYSLGGLCLSLGIALSLPVESPDDLCPETAWAYSGMEDAEPLALQSEDPRVSEYVNGFSMGPIQQGRRIETWKALAKGQAKAEKRPNILLLMLESVPKNRLGYEGHYRETSPNLDRLARESWRFRRAWSTSGQSNYAQPAVLSSQIPIRTLGLDTYQSLHYPRMIFHEYFKALGYETAVISSQNEEWLGMMRFQLVHEHPDKYFHSRDHEGPHIGVGHVAKIADHITTDKILEWFEQREESEPWALYVNFQRTHFPYELPPGYQGSFQPSKVQGPFSFLFYMSSQIPTVMNRFDNALEYVDKQVGRIRNALLALGELDNTIIVVSSDHGEHFFERGYAGHGQSLSETETRVPLLVSWPGTLEPKDVREPVSTIDIMPSLAELIGGPEHPSWQGRSFVADAQSTLEERAEKNPRPAKFMRVHAIEREDGLVCWPWKLTYNRATRRRFLYNLEVDPTEKDNQVDRRVFLAAVLWKLLKTQIDAQLEYYLGIMDDPDSELKDYGPPIPMLCPSDEALRELSEMS